MFWWVGVGLVGVGAWWVDWGWIEASDFGLTIRLGWFGDLEQVLVAICLIAWWSCRLPW